VPPVTHTHPQTPTTTTYSQSKIIQNRPTRTRTHILLTFSKRRKQLLSLDITVLLRATTVRVGLIHSSGFLVGFDPIVVGEKIK